MLEPLIPNVMIFGDEVFTRGLSHEDRVFMNRINALIRRDMREMFPLLCEAIAGK